MRAAPRRRVPTSRRTRPRHRASECRPRRAAAKRAADRAVRRAASRAAPDRSPDRPRRARTRRASRVISSARPALRSRLAPLRENGRSPTRVTTGTPIHSASQVVVPPAHGRLSSAMSAREVTREIRRDRSLADLLDALGRDALARRRMPAPARAGRRRAWPAASGATSAPPRRMRAHSASAVREILIGLFRQTNVMRARRRRGQRTDVGRLDIRAVAPLRQRQPPRALRRRRPPTAPADRCRCRSGGSRSSARRCCRDSRAR